MRHPALLSAATALALAAPLTLSAQQRTGALAAVPPGKLAADTPSVATAPTPSGSASTDTSFLHAQQLVAMGQGDSARAIVQAKLDAATRGSPQWVEALYWRAVVAATAAGAERDLRQIVVDYPLSAHSADALMRLAQLEMARGDRAAALAHLRRVVVEHPGNPARARAEFWMGRTLLDEGQTARGCLRLADARRHAAASDVELRNQIDYVNQRCAGVSLDTTAPPPAQKAPHHAPATKAPHRAPATKAPHHAPATKAARGGAVHGAVTRNAATRSTSTRSATKAPAPTAAHQTTAAPPGRPAPVSRRASRPVAHHPAYTVQVAAFAARPAADHAAAALRARGYPAHVNGRVKPFRVQIGSYSTRAGAAALEKRLAAAGVHGFITEAPAP